MDEKCDAKSNFAANLLLFFLFAQFVCSNVVIIVNLVQFPQMPIVTLLCVMLLVCFGMLESTLFAVVYRLSSSLTPVINLRCIAVGGAVAYVVLSIVACILALCFHLLWANTSEDTDLSPVFLLFSVMYACVSSFTLAWIERMHVQQTVYRRRSPKRVGV